MSAISVPRASLGPLVADLGQLVGLLVPNGGDDTVLDLNQAWFGAPLEQLRQAVTGNADKIGELLGGILGAVGGNAMGLPVASALFGILIRPAGLLISTLVLVVVAGAAYRSRKPWPLLFYAIAMAVGCVVVFPWLLGQQIPILGSWFDR